MGILKVNDMIPDFANFCTFKGRPRATAFSKVPATVGRGSVPRRAAITVGRGPVPRRAAIVTENVRHLCASDVFCPVCKFAGDRPPRDGVQQGSGHRRARACPSPCRDCNRRRQLFLGVGRFLSRLEVRGRQAPALRKKDVFPVPFGSSRGQAPALQKRSLFRST